MMIDWVVRVDKSFLCNEMIPPVGFGGQQAKKQGCMYIVMTDCVIVVICW